MRWLLVEPPVQSDIQASLGAVGIPSSAYLAPILERNNEEVRIEDAPALDHNLEDVADVIRDYDPDYVGISALTTDIEEAYRVAEAAKKSDQSRKVILGGAHPTLRPKETLEECSSVDIVARGEGEEIIDEISRFEDLSRIKGISYRENGNIIENQDREPIMDLDSLPFPAYHLLPMERYEFDGIRYATMITSRGCPFNCVFCASSRICGKKWRGKSPERVLEQMKALRYDYDVKEIEILDDTFVLDKNRATEICDLMVEEGLDITWSCSSRVDTMDSSLAEKLREAGCHTVYMGIESGVQEVLDRLKKGITIEQARDAVEAVKEADMNVVGSFILGVPGETKKQMEKTIDFAKELDITLAQFTLFTPYPGTESYVNAEENDLFLTKDWSDFSTLDPIIKNDEMSAEELKNFMRQAYIRFYLRPSYIWRAVKTGELWSLLKKGISWFI
ncbi:hypothetical protein AKJ40_02580 [candidate division MSBL1 archaeon SCGC-AAA259M10]|uniref:Uncharacterized protein n=1 Tax=candidate division MSBL1 archaeon SCGC-AAA259M10 TaxID=1698270 RepID=A0A133UZS4_9EURY|nr:hypothetical protein AKJ40_02580 [candidate division MSBL1 archaeon SCGC-AAA259M10]